MAEPSAKNLLELLERSGIADDSELKGALDSLSEKASGRVVQAKELAVHLIDSGVITQWHADKLLAGKYKGFFLDKYKLLGLLGTGGMSSVYLAEAKNTGQKRAIKVLPKKKVSDKSYLDRFYREGKAAASLSHPNIVRIYDINNAGDTHYMVMEYVQGADLYQRVKENGPLSIDDAIDAIIQSAEGLQHAHQIEMVHRDIKPANLLQTDSGDVKLLDLGLALFRQEGEESLTVLYNEKVMGTADYLSPEQAVNSHTVDHRADIYSLGCTLYFLLTGRPPFDKGTLAQRIAMHQTQEPESIASLRQNCPQGLVDICSKMMRKKPDDRYNSCDEIVVALEQLRQLLDSDDGTHKSTLPAVATPSLDSDSKSAASTESSDLAEKPDVGFDPEFAVNTSDVLKDGEESVVPVAAPLKPTRAPVIRRKRRKSTPSWLVPSLIVFMIAILIGVLLLVSQLSASP